MIKKVKQIKRLFKLQYFNKLCNIVSSVYFIFDLQGLNEFTWQDRIMHLCVRNIGHECSICFQNN